MPILLILAIFKQSCEILEESEKVFLKRKIIILKTSEKAVEIIEQFCKTFKKIRGLLVLNISERISKKFGIFSLPSYQKIWKLPAFTTQIVEKIQKLFILSARKYGSTYFRFFYL